MLSLFYGIIFIASLIFTGVYVYNWHKHFDVNFTMIYTLVPVACVGYLLASKATTLDSAVAAQKIIYIGGCFLQLFITLSIFNLCKFDIPKWMRTAMFAISSVIYLSVLTIGDNKFFYTSVKLDTTGKTPLLIREYGPMHAAYIVMLMGFFFVGMAALIYSWFKKKEAPRRVLMLLVIPDIICVLCYAVTKIIGIDIDILPAGYIIADVTYLFIAHRVILYDVGDTVIDTMVHEAAIGYVTLDYEYRYLGSNEMAQILLPEISDVAVDEKIGYNSSERKLRHYIEGFRKDNADNKFLFTQNTEDGNIDTDRYYDVEVSYLFDGNRRRGYIITFTDDTENKKYIKLLDRYNDDLKEQVNAKTQHIVQMHDNLIMSLAMMVESRDNSTGGHIKRTSDGVRILVDEIIKEGKLDLSPEFCKAVIKAAPMHDLGKIAVDDAVLRKPGRFEPEEFEKMKKHAEEGARVIHEILLNTDDDNFKVIAENVAHYHHERYDGSGYPEGLKGEQIPLEARIMAIADVYDALVSKRVYKDAFSLEKADSIILEGMGTQFDPKLQTAYENARPRLEAYYCQDRVQS